MSWPDLGQAYWDMGFRGTLHLANINCTNLVDYGHERELTGVLYGDTLSDTLCVTLRTTQSVPALLRLIDESGIWKGRLSPTTDTGRSGEVYRVVVGSVVPLTN